MNKQGQLNEQASEQAIHPSRLPHAQIQQFAGITGKSFFQHNNDYEDYDQATPRREQVPQPSPNNKNKFVSQKYDKLDFRLHPQAQRKAYQLKMKRYKEAQSIYSKQKKEFNKMNPSEQKKEKPKGSRNIEMMVFQENPIMQRQNKINKERKEQSLIVQNIQQEEQEKKHGSAEDFRVSKTMVLQSKRSKTHHQRPEDIDNGYVGLQNGSSDYLIENQRKPLEMVQVQNIFDTPTFVSTNEKDISAVPPQNISSQVGPKIETQLVEVIEVENIDQTPSFEKINGNVTPSKSGKPISELSQDLVTQHPNTLDQLSKKTHLKMVQCNPPQNIEKKGQPQQLDEIQFQKTLSNTLQPTNPSHSNNNFVKKPQILDEINFRRLKFLSDLPSGTQFQRELILDQNCVKSIWPQFTLNTYHGQKFLMNAKKTSTFPNTVFTISCSQGDFKQNSPYCLGTIQANWFGDVLNVFGPGLRPSEAKAANQTPRELLATIVYQTKILPTSIPRKFLVYVKEQTAQYYKAFAGVVMYDEEIPLHILYENKDNKDKIVKFKNREPKWIEGCRAYMLNLGKKAKEPAVQNFILEQATQQQQNKKDLVLLSKESENKFYLKMSNPLSPYLAFAIVLSNFTKRFIGQ